jgi:hypothetical protein
MDTIKEDIELVTGTMFIFSKIMESHKYRELSCQVWLSYSGKEN